MNTPEEPVLPAEYKPQFPAETTSLLKFTDGGINDTRHNTAFMEGIVDRSIEEFARKNDASLKQGDTEELLRLGREEKKKVLEMKRHGYPREEIENYIRSFSANQKKIKSFYEKLGIARMLLQGDWTVNRTKEISQGLGIVSFPEIETILLRFYYENGLLVTKAPVQEGKLTSMHWGCGNGILPHLLRKDKTSPFDNDRTILNYFKEVGYADYIYYTLNDLLITLLKDEYKDENNEKHEALIEFINVISTLLLRKIVYTEELKEKQSRKIDLKKTQRKKRTSATKTLTKLPKNVNKLKPVMRNLHKHIKNLQRYAKIKGDYEFLHDEPIEISEECQNIIQEYFSNIGDDEKENEKHIQKFLKKYFKSEMRLPSSNLAEFITMHPHNVILGKFEEIAKVFSHIKEPFIHLAHSYKSSSHLTDGDYGEFLYEVATHLKPGGIFFDDVTESYTRKKRIDEVQSIKNRLGSEYNVELIGDENGPKSVFMQRGIEEQIEAYNMKIRRFFKDEEKQKLIREECYFAPIEDFSLIWPKAVVRNKIIDQIKDLFIEKSFTPSDTPEEKTNKVNMGRVKFRMLHDRIDQILEKKFQQEDWHIIIKELKELGKDDDHTFENFILDSWKTIRREIKMVRKKLAKVYSHGGQNIVPTNT